MDTLRIKTLDLNDEQLWKRFNYLTGRINETGNGGLKFARDTVVNELRTRGLWPENYNLLEYQAKRCRVLSHTHSLEQHWVERYDDVVDELYATFVSHSWDHVKQD